MILSSFNCKKMNIHFGVVEVCIKPHHTITLLCIYMYESAQKVLYSLHIDHVFIIHDNVLIINIKRQTYNVL